MNYLYDITIIGFLVGTLGTGLGGVISLLIKKTNKIMSFLLGLTGGFMLFISTFHLIPESFYVSGNILMTIMGIALGLVFIVIVELYVDIIGKNPYIKSSILLGISIAVHNFPEGLALGSSFWTMSNLGPTLALAMLVHNIPEGVAMAVPLNVSRESPLKILFYTFIIGIPTGIGSFLGGYLGTFSQNIIALCLSFSGGTMLYIICDELIPNAKNLSDGKGSSIGVIFGFLAGVLLYMK